MSMIQFTECVVLLYNEHNQVIGTGFRLNKSNQIVTAKHVVVNQRRIVIESIKRYADESSFAIVTRIEWHPNELLDIAVIYTNDNDVWQFFQLASKREFELGNPVETFGYPLVSTLGNLQEISPRVLLGNIQRHFVFTQDDSSSKYQYDAFELSFPAFGGQSGSPVFRYYTTGSEALASLEVLGVLTASTPVFQAIDEQSFTHASWAVCLSLFSISDWLGSLM